MVQVNPASTNAVRAKTGAGVTDCAAALKATGGDIDAAVEWLRAKGLFRGPAKERAPLKEGVVVTRVEGSSKVAMIELMTQTEFVAEDPKFMELAELLADTALRVGGDVATLLRSDCVPGKPVEDLMVQMGAAFGQRIGLRRAASLSVGQGGVGSYDRHLGRGGVVVAVECEKGGRALQTLSGLLPINLWNAYVLESSGKTQPAAAASDGVAGGRVRELLAERVYLDSPSIGNANVSIRQMIEQAAKEIGAPITSIRFALFDITDPDGP